MENIVAVLIIVGIIMSIGGIEARRAKQHSYGNGARNATFASILGVGMVALGIYVALHQQMG